MLHGNQRGRTYTEWSLILRSYRIMTGVAAHTTHSHRHNKLCLRKSTNTKSTNKSYQKDDDDDDDTHTFSSAVQLATLAVHPAQLVSPMVVLT